MIQSGMNAAEGNAQKRSFMFANDGRHHFPGIKLLLWFICLLSLWVVAPYGAGKAYAQSFALPPSELELVDSTDRSALDPYIEILEDKKHEWSIADVSSSSFSKLYTPYNGEGRPNFGYSNSIHWVKFHIHNQSNLEEWLLEIESPKINYAALHYKQEDGDGWTIVTAGNWLPFDEREVRHRHFLYKLPLEQGERQTFYLQIYTGSSVQTALTVWHAAAANERAQLEYILLGLGLGISLVMALYNLFLYFSVGGRSYLYYVLFVLLNSLLYLADTGLAYQFLWPQWTEWNSRSITTLMLLTNIGGLLFARSFLETRSKPKLDRIFKLLIICSLLAVCWRQITYTGLVYAAIALILLSIIFIISTAIVSVRKGSQPARYFLMAWSIFLLGVFVSLMVDSGLIPLTMVTKYAWQVTTFMEVVLLSFALGARFKRLREEKEEALLASKEIQDQAIASLKRTDELKDEFLAITSHELRTPLYGIIGVAETMRDGAAGPLTKEVQSHLSMIIASGRRLTTLIEDILVLSKLKQDTLELYLTPVQVKGLVDVVLSVCQPLIQGKPLHLINRVSPTAPLILADENRMQQILYNLVGNAIKYTERGEIIVSAEAHAEFLYIAVSDTGWGISPQEIPHLFENYRRGGGTDTPANGGGMGIGLSITRRLVELQGGWITLDSEVGKGSLFTFAIPVSGDRPVEEHEEGALTLPYDSSVSLLPGTEEMTDIVAPQHHANTKSKNATILIADDELINLQVLTNQLVMEGYEVVAVSNGEDVLEQMRKRPVDLLILDIMMPKLSGYEVCRQLRESYQLTDLPIIMLTARNQTGDKVAAFEAGANDYLIKPCNKSELLARVQTLIRLNELNKEAKNTHQRLEDRVAARTRELEAINHRLLDANTAMRQMAQSRQYLLANISHELGTPITYIHGYMQALEEGILSTDQPRYLNMVFNKLGVLERLTQDLLDLSKLEAKRLDFCREDLTLSHWASHIQEQCSLDVRQAERQFVYEVIGSPALLQERKCRIDKKRMDQVFFNLISNALKHTTIHDGVITLAIEVLPFDRKVIFEIRDNGCGINQEALPHLFERFYKAPSSELSNGAGGTGLGLAIVKEIVEAHDGRVWAESQPDQGSSFYVALPIS